MRTGRRIAALGVLTGGLLLIGFAGPSLADTGLSGPETPSVSVQVDAPALDQVVAAAGVTLDGQDTLGTDTPGTDTPADDPCSTDPLPCLPGDPGGGGGNGGGNDPGDPGDPGDGGGDGGCGVVPVDCGDPGDPGDPGDGGGIDPCTLGVAIPGCAPIPGTGDGSGDGSGSDNGNQGNGNGNGNGGQGNGNGNQDSGNGGTPSTPGSGGNGPSGGPQVEGSRPGSTVSGVSDDVTSCTDAICRNTVPAGANRTAPAQAQAALPQTGAQQDLRGLALVGALMVLWGAWLLRPRPAPRHRGAL